MSRPRRHGDEEDHCICGEAETEHAEHGPKDETCVHDDLLCADRIRDQREAAWERELEQRAAAREEGWR